MKNLPFILLLLISGNAFSFDFPSPSENTAKVILNNSITAKQIFPVNLLMVNGENVSIRNSAVWLSPGNYELKFAAQVDRKFTQQVLSPKERRGLKDWNTTMVLKVEADKSYYVGFDASSNDAENWRPVVYKVK